MTTPEKNISNDREWKGKVSEKLDHIARTLDDANDHMRDHIDNFDKCKERCHDVHSNCATDFNTRIVRHDGCIHTLTQSMSRIFKIVIGIGVAVVGAVIIHTILNK